MKANKLYPCCVAALFNIVGSDPNDLCVILIDSVTGGVKVKDRLSDTV